ncbi:nucleotidyltransferase family protein [Companilactobacillus jidongensis]|uniref:hypothetical protein n=1 Tax=Companilactobacillus jidongensis TaxID=2486006 RepID=UPI000F77F8B2|nr:hypothetical protein [Companilactobacillus jidongensis]
MNYYDDNEVIHNLRKLSVDLMVSDDYFMNIELIKYLSELEDWTDFNKEYFRNLQDKYNFRYRVKKVTTIIEKIKHNLNRHRYVSKILNDLFGERIILDNVTKEMEQIERLLFNLKEESIIYRYYYRNDGNYHAFHCYIQDENNHFPWEFQIWDSSNELINYLEHDRHEEERRGQK